MRFIHTSDWHLGRRLQSVDLLDAQAAFLSWLLETAVAHEVDAVVVAGDVYDRSLPPAEAVSLLDHTLAAFSAAGVPMFLIPGNHDHPVRLRYGDALFAQAGIHVRADVAAIDSPLILSDAHGDVGFYGIPYLIPDAVMVELAAERSHESVLEAAMARIRADAAARGLDRTVVAAHAFVTGGAGSESEREIRVGGVGDTPARVFRGVSYVALGHLHGPQLLSGSEDGTTLAYSGSPLAFSFSERDHVKSVALVELDSTGGVRVERLAAPVPRPLRQVRGSFEEVLAIAAADDTGLTEAWVKAVLTDVVRPESPMERLRAVLPHTIALEFEPDSAHVAEGDAPARITATTDPVEIVRDFVEAVTGQEPDEDMVRIIDEVVESVASARTEH